MVEPPAEEPLLRTLAPALRELHKRLRDWLQGHHAYPLSALTKANLEALVEDLDRKANSLQAEKPLLVIMLVGGTGVGKSTLLNALAGGPIAKASFERPTTRDPVVYYHESVSPDRLDPALQQCRLVQHSRSELEQKILVDTPDIDSNDLNNRQKLLELLPVADVVLYVGSQEKYHDRLAWDLFLEEQKRRAFAFILNKWDRCSDTAEGVSPDQDLLRDLKAAGFEQPLLFRTCAQYWVDRQSNGEAQTEPPSGEEFTRLVEWIEAGLTRLEIEAIKARGVAQLLAQLDQALQRATPPDLAETAKRVQEKWKRLVSKESESNAEILINTLIPYRKEIEHHFAAQRQGHFHGLMGGYLRLVNKVKYAGSTLRDRIPMLPRSSEKSLAPVRWDLAAFTRSCTDEASERHLSARSRALASRLLVAADDCGFPLKLLHEAVEQTATDNWSRRYSQALIEVLNDVEHAWTKPRGVRRITNTLLVLLSDWVPLLVLLVAFAIPLWKYFVEGEIPSIFHFVAPFLALLATLVLLHLLIAVFLPLRWEGIRSHLEGSLADRLAEELRRAYLPIPQTIAEDLAAERRRIESLRSEVAEVAGWLKQREEATRVAALYGRNEL